MKKTLTLLAQLLLPLLGFSQSIVSLSPNNGNAGQTLDVTITGASTNFSQGASSVYAYFGQGSSTAIYANTVSVLSTTVMVANFTIPQFTSPGNYSIVTNSPVDGNVIASNAFTVNNTSAALVSINPNAANAGQTLDVTITGANTNFGQGNNQVSINFAQGSGTTTLANSTSVIDDTHLTANFTVPQATQNGYYSLSVSNPTDGSLNLYSSFQVVNGSTSAISSVSPNVANQGQTLDVSIYGWSTNFSQGAPSTVNFSFNQGSGTTVVNTTSIINDSLITVNITVPQNTAPVYYDVSVINAVDGSVTAYNVFHITGITPHLAAVSPNVGNAGQVLDVTITGNNTHFAQAGNNAINFTFGQGSSTVVNFYNVLDDSTITANITVPANTLEGFYSLSISNSLDANLYLANCFYVLGTVSNNFYITVNTTNATSADSCNGSAVFTSFNDGGSVAYSLTDQNLNPVNSSGDSAKNLCPGIYIVWANDANGDSASVGFIISEPGQIFNASSDDSLTLYPLIYNGVDTVCSINYSGIDSISIGNYFINPGSTSVFVEWNVYHGSFVDTILSVYTVDQSGEYNFVLQLYCDSTRAVEYIIAYDNLYITLIAVGICDKPNTSTTVYPVPFSNSMNLITTSDLATSVSILNTIGQEVISQISFSGKGKHTLAIPELPQGSYILKITNASKVEFVRVIKE